MAEAEPSEADYHYGARVLGHVFERYLLRQVVQVEMTGEGAVLRVGDCEVRFLVEKKLSSKTLCEHLDNHPGEKILLQVVSVEPRP